MPRARVLIFAKYPEPGRVKTRLVGPLSPVEAAELHRASLLAVCEAVTACDGLDVTLVVTPDDRATALGSIVPGALHDCWRQGDGDLGARLTRACRGAFDEGAGPVICLGADSPTLPIAYLLDAVDRLAEHDVVLGPCDDGGYYLLGLGRHIPQLFERIDCGSGDVATQTRHRAIEAGVDLHELPGWYDLDRYEDLARAAGDLKLMIDASRPAANTLRRLIESYLER